MMVTDLLFIDVEAQLTICVHNGKNFFRVENSKISGKKLILQLGQLAWIEYLLNGYLVM